MQATRTFHGMRSFPVFPRFSRQAGTPLFRCLAVGLAGGAFISLGGCADSSIQHLASGHSKEYFPSSIYGAASPRVVADGEPVPRGGGTYMVGKPYSIAGRTYYPSERRYAATGLASWYGDAFHGRRTANGEVYDRDSVSAAHPTMPLPSYARVTNLRNNHSIIVRVNDRGPFTAHRIMDVSRKTAEALDFRHRGTTHVKVEYIGAASLEGSNDEKLLATLRMDAPASLAGLESRERSQFAENAPYPIAAADILAVATDEAVGVSVSAAARRVNDHLIPLPPARPSGLGKTAGIKGLPVALR